MLFYVDKFFALNIKSVILPDRYAGNLDIITGDSLQHLYFVTLFSKFTKLKSPS